MKILSPAGNLSSLKVAIINGADEVYLGLNSFNARNNIDGFDINSLAEAVNFAHIFNVKVHLAINILFTNEELQLIVERTSRVLNMPIESDAALSLAMRSRGTPRIANRLFKRVRDFALVEGNGNIDMDITNLALKRLKVDDLGLNNTDHELLLAIINKFNGGPVGVEALSSSIGEEVTTIEDVYEPYLLQIGLLKRTSRGRVVTPKAYELLGIEYKK